MVIAELILLDGENAIVEEQQHSSVVVAQRRSIEEGDLAVHIIICMLWSSKPPKMYKSSSPTAAYTLLISLAWIASTRIDDQVYARRG